MARPPMSRSASTSTVANRLIALLSGRTWVSIAGKARSWAEEINICAGSTTMALTVQLSGCPEPTFGAINACKCVYPFFYCYW